MNKKKLLLTALLAAAMGTGAAQAQVIVWEGSDGDDWDNTSWNPSQPASPDDVSVINNVGTFGQTLFYTELGGDPNLNTLVIDGLGTGAMKLEISGTLSVLGGAGSITTIGGSNIGPDTTVVGDLANAEVTLTSGGVLNTGTLILGAQAGSQGTVNVVTDSAINVSSNATLIVGDAGSGTYFQGGGATTAVNLIVANQPDSFGSVSVASGTFDVSHDGLASGGTGNAIIGNFGGGLSGGGYFAQYNPTGNDSVVTIGVGATAFNPSSPTDPYGGYLVLGRNDGSYGKYVMTDYNLGGALTLTVGNEIQVGGSNIGGNSCGVGQSCTGVFEQFGGTVTAGSVTLGIGAGVGTYTLTTGDLTVLGQLVIGKGDGNLNPTVLNGLFTQSGGTVTAAQVLIGGYVDSIPDPIDPINNPPTFVSNLGTGRYELSAGTVTSQFTMVGYLSQGRVLQTGGTFNAGELQLGGAGLFAVSNGPGYDFYSSGTYDLQGGILNTDSTTISIFGQGTFNQGGASEHHVTNNLVVGSQPALIEPNSGVARQGIYTMAGGLLTVGGTTIIGAGNGVGVDPGFPGEPGAKGTFIQSGGIATLTGDLIIGQGGANAGGNGQYTMSGGALSAANIAVGQGGFDLGIGTFDQSGGTVSTGSLTIANGSVYNLTGSVGGSILGSVFTIVSEGGPGLAQFNQSGGTHTTEFLNVGIVGFSNGEYNQSGGDLFVKANMNAGGGNATGVYNQTGGNATANSAGFGFGLFVGGGGTGSGTYNLSETDGPASLAVLGDSFIGADGVGTVNHSGGMLTTNNLYIGGEPIFAPTPNDGNGTYNLSGSGNLVVSGTTVVGYDATGTFNQSGGTHTTGQLIVGQTADGFGTYNLSGGTLNDNAIIGDAGIGVFNNSGGTHNVTGDLILGNLVTGDGTYNLSATGTLLQSAGRVIVGREGTGNLSVAGTSSLAAGGEVVVGQLAGSTGTASVSGSGSLTTGGFFPWLIVGGQGTGTFTQAGTSQVTASGLRLGEGASGTGTYTLNGGTLAVYSTGAVDGGSRIGLAGTGTLTQNGGTHNTTYMEIGGATFGQGSGGSGTYNLNAGSLTATGTITVREAFSGTSGILNVAGGALSAPLIVNNDQVNYSGGTIAANVSNNASFNVSGGAARTLTGDLTNNPGGVVTVAVASPLTITGTLSNAAGAQIQADANIIVATAYSNAAFGSGNTFDHRANVSGAGQIQSSNVNAATQQQISVNGGAASSANAVISFGNVHVGDTVNKNYAISNLAGGPALTGAIQTSVNGGNLTDARLTGAGVTAGNWTAAAGGSTAALGVAFNASTAGALTGQVVNVRNNFDNTNSQTVTFTGAAYNLASVAGGGITPDPIVLANQRVGGTLTQALTITNTAPAGAFTETLSASFGTNTGNATNNAGTASGIAGGASSVGALQAGVNTSVAGLRSGTVTVNLASNEVGGSGLGTTALTAQTIDVSGNVYNVAVGSTTPTPIVFANRHVGDAASQVLTVQNTAPTGLFSEALNASFSGATGNATNNAGSVVNLAAGGSNSAAMSVGLDTSAAGARSGSVTIAYESDGTGANGNSGLAAIAAGSQVINVSGDVYRLAAANTLAAINFGVVHVGDTVGQALTIQNTAVNDGYSEKLNASFGGTSDVRITTSGSISQLAAGASNTTTMVVGLNTAAVGVVSGTATVNFASDGTGTSGLGITALPSQIVGVDGDIQLSGTVFRLAQPSAHSPEPVTLANVRVGGSSTQALTISNLAPDDGFSEKLNASIGGATTGVTASGAFTLLAPGAPGNPAATNSTSLVVGLDTASAGSKSGTATITLVSDGDGTSGLGQTSLGTQTVNISGNVYNMAVGAATPDPIAFANRRVGDAATQVLTVANTAAAGSFSEALNASFSAVTGSASHNSGTINDLIAGGNNSVAMSVSLDTASAGAKTGSVTLAYQSDGTGANGNSGLAAIDAGSQTIGVSGNVYNMAVGAATPDPIVMNRRVGDAATQALTVSNTATAGSFSEALNASFSAATGSASHNGGTISDLIAGGNNSVAMSVSLDTASAGAKTGSVTLAYQSDGTGANGNSGLAAIAAGTQVIAVSGNVYQQAVGQVNGTTVDFGIVHVGDVVTDKNLSVSNIAPVVALNDTMAGSLNGVSGPFGAVGSLTGLAAGQTDTTSLAIGLDTSAAGVFNDAAMVNFVSQNPDMADLDIEIVALSLTGTVNNYAESAFAFDSGAGSFSQSGTIYTLDFGTVFQGSGLFTTNLLARNAAAGPADLLDGLFQFLDSVDFGESGFNPFTDLAAGGSYGPLMLAFDTSNLGFFADDIVLHGIGHNASGYSAAVDDITLRIRGTVVERTNGVPEPGALAMVALGLLLLIGARRRQSRGAHPRR